MRRGEERRKSRKRVERGFVILPEAEETDLGEWGFTIRIDIEEILLGEEGGDLTKGGGEGIAGIR